ncbi:MAG TPA: hypothetical protein VMK84_10085 [Streptosporangiaceae bacterium]|nr:hypothetical protein [Streptosporangiaceae bacterium]
MPTHSEGLAQVAGPTMLSRARPWTFWNAMTAWYVFAGFGRLAR